MQGGDTVYSPKTVPSAGAGALARVSRLGPASLDSRESCRRSEVAAPPRGSQSVEPRLISG